MSREPSLRLEDILEAAALIESYIDGFDDELFMKDQRTVDAVVRNLEIVGEAVKHLPEEMTNLFPEIPWKAIAGFRDILAHCYFRTEEAIVWDVAKNHIPQLAQVIRKIHS
ncbi:MAG: DUF86 domain-containing protein [Verrucomicrobia bacterium]|jgi:uncharacterized protein with HEPN domain|nr:MAG: DUF86 domain-containing protein [Verrucomicrobiota bacterium]